MCLVCKFVLTCINGNISFSAKYVAGINNDITDELSPFQEEFWDPALSVITEPEAFNGGPMEPWELII